MLCPFLTSIILNSFIIILIFYKGWGEFDVQLRVNFKSDRLKPIEHQHDLKLYHGPEVKINQHFETDLKIRVPEDMFELPEKVAASSEKKVPEISESKVLENIEVKVPESSVTKNLENTATKVAKNSQVKDSEYLETKVFESSNAKVSENQETKISENLGMICEEMKSTELSTTKETSAANELETNDSEVQLNESTSSEIQQSRNTETVCADLYNTSPLADLQQKLEEGDIQEFVLDDSE